MSLKPPAVVNRVWLEHSHTYLCIIFGSFCDTKAELRSCSRDHLVHIVLTIWLFKKKFANPCFSWYIRGDARSTIILGAILLKILWFLFQRNTYTPEERPSIKCITAEETRNAQANWPCYYWNLGSRGRVGIMGDQGVCWEVRKWLISYQIFENFITSELKKW